MNVRLLVIGAALACGVASAACSRRAVTVEYRAGHTFTSAERAAIEAIVDRAAPEARRLLPALPEELRVTVQPGSLATAFERDFGGAPTPWGQYPENVEDWTNEILALPPDAPREPWMFRHPDGRRWIGFKVGTYLADRAVQSSGLTVPQLATVPTRQIIEWARRP